MSQIFLFTKGAKIGNETRKQLREAGIVPVEVESLDAVKLLNASAPEVDTGVILRAAMRAINKSESTTQAVTKIFAIELTAILGKEPTA